MDAKTQFDLEVKKFKDLESNSCQHRAAVVSMHSRIIDDGPSWRNPVSIEDPRYKSLIAHRDASDAALQKQVSVLKSLGGTLVKINGVVTWYLL